MSRPVSPFKFKSEMRNKEVRQSNRLMNRIIIEGRHPQRTLLLCPRTDTLVGVRDVRTNVRGDIEPRVQGRLL